MSLLKMLVAVSQRVDFYQNRGEVRDALDQRLDCFLSDAGHIPVPVPNRLLMNNSNGDLFAGRLVEWLERISPQAVVLSGGNNLEEFPERDTTECLLLDYALRGRLPVLGICRGMQMLASWSGAKLERVDGHVRTRHKLQGEFNHEVNSYHELSIRGCPSEFRVIATSEDGNIEAIRHNSLPWEGWMWHPEREATFCEADILRLNNLFK